MKLLIFTQKVDVQDSQLSFFHRWIIELAKHFDEVNVICLYEGLQQLPANIKVHSLGKESGRSRWKYVWRFFRYIWTLRTNYDVVFVHQNQEYVLLGGLLWKVLGKKVYMWRNHYAGSFLTDLAAALSTKIFCTSKYSYTAKFANTVFMPVGVDAEIFAPQAGLVRQPHSILSLGRIAPSKKLEQLISALVMIHKDGVDFTATIVGDSFPQDRVYVESLKKKVQESGLSSKVNFKSGIPNEKAPDVYAAHEIFVNLSKSGMFDKTLFEAMLCGTLVISSSKDLADKIDPEYIFEQDNVEQLASKLRHLLSLSPEAQEGRGELLRRFAEEHHSLSMLGSRLAEEMQ